MTDQTSGVLPSGGTPSIWLNRALSSLNALGSLWIFLLMLLICADAFGRTLFTAPIDGVNEIIELSLVGIVFLQLGDATRRGRLIRSTGCFHYILKQRPPIGRAMGFVFELLGIIFMVIILYGSIPFLIESIERDYFVGNIGLFTAPVWPVKLVIVIGCFATLLQFFTFAMRYLRPDDGAEKQQLSPYK